MSINVLAEICNDHNITEVATLGHYEDIYENERRPSLYEVVILRNLLLVDTLGYLHLLISKCALMLISQWLV